MITETVLLPNGTRKLMLVSILFLSFGSTFTQPMHQAQSTGTATFTLSYFGNNLVNPGLDAGVNFILIQKTTTKSKTRKNGKTVDKSSTKQLLAGTDVGFFWQPESHVGAFNYYNLTYRNIKLKNNSYSIIGIGPGVYRSFYPRTFEVDDAGNVNEQTLGGRTYFAPVLIVGTGKFKKDSFFHALSFTTNLLFLFNYNGGIVPLLNFEIGFCFDFKK